jgi:hypothetical protein
MAKTIPNELTQIRVVESIADISAPTVAEIEAGVDITGLVVSLEASTRGNVVNTPALDSLFETTIPGTVTATFTMEVYRDDENDTAWDTLPRGTSTHVVIARFGFGGATPSDPAAADVVEVWPVDVVSRSAAPLTSNESQRANIECTVPVEPDEEAEVAA